MTHEGLVQELREYARRGEKLLGGGSLCFRAAAAIEILDRICDGYETENKKLTEALRDSFAIDLMDKLEKAERERDAAVKDLRECAIESCTECMYCSRGEKDTLCWNCTNGSNWEWIGLKDENNS